MNAAPQPGQRRAHPGRTLGSWTLLAVLLLATLVSPDGHADTASPPPALVPFRNWVDQWLAADRGAGGTLDAGAIARGQTLARERRATFRALMRDDPASALRFALPAEIRRQLPAVVADEVEREVSGLGDLEVLCAYFAVGQPAQPDTRRYVRLSGQRYEAHVYGRRLAQVSKRGIPLRGVVLDGQIALDENVLRETGARTTFTDLRTPAERAQPGPAVFAEMAGRAYAFASRNRLGQMERTLRGLEMGPSPLPRADAAEVLDGRAPQPAGPRFAPESAFTTGNKKVLVVRVDFVDRPGDPVGLNGGPVYTAAYLQDFSDNQVAHYYERSSFRQASLTTTVTAQRYRLPRPAATYATTATGNDDLHADALALAAADYPLATYDKLVVVFAHLGDLAGSQIKYGGLAEVAGSRLWINGEFDFRVMVHELGHSFGLLHAGLWHVADGDPASRLGTQIEYGDSFDTMGGNPRNDTRTDFGPYAKNRLDWLPDAQVQTVATDGTYQVNRTDSTVSPAGTGALRVAKDGARDYWVGVRRSFPDNASLAHGANITWSNADGTTSLLDMVSPGEPPPGQTAEEYDAALPIGTTFLDTDSNIELRPLDEGGNSGREFMQVAVRLVIPANDQFANAAPLSGVTAQTTGSNARSTKEPGEPAHAGDGGGQSVWWRWTAPQSGWVSADTAGSHFDTLLAVYTGSAVNGLAEIAFDDQSGPDNTSALGFLATAGTTYFIAVDGWHGATGAIKLRLAVQLPAPVAAPATLVNLSGFTANWSAVPGATGYRLDLFLVNPAGAPVLLHNNLDVGNVTAYALRGLGSNGRYRYRVRATAPPLTSVDSNFIDVTTNATNTPPTISGPGNATILANETFGPVTFTVDDIDSPPASLLVRATSANGQLVPPSSIVLGGSGSARTITITPAAGKTGTATITLQVSDNAVMTHHSFTLAVGAYRVTTSASSAGSAGSADGTAGLNRFSGPTAVAVDGAGNIYVADAVNQVIRKITPAGLVSTLAGAAGQPGSADGPGPQARFFNPMGIAVDTAGNVYVADTSNQLIRKIASDGTVTTLAGSPLRPGTDDGFGPTARFYNPGGVTVDAAGNVYVADTSAETIRKISPARVVSTIAGSAQHGGDLVDGTGPAARFNGPAALAFDAGGTLYIAETRNHAIRKMSPAGAVTTLASNVGLNTPRGLAVDPAGNVYVTDFQNHLIRRISGAGAVTTLAGTSTPGAFDGRGASAAFNLPYGLARSPTGELVVGDMGNHTIRKISGDLVTTFAGAAGNAGWTDGARATARFYIPLGVAVDAAGNRYIADSSNHTVRKITPAGVVTTLAGLAGNPGFANGTGATARFRLPYAIALDAAGNLFVTDRGNHAIRRITPGGVVSTLAGDPGEPNSTDGPVATARFRNPAGIVIDGSGTLYLADSSNHTIRRINPAGVVDTIAGNAGSSGTDNGPGNAARFKTPLGLALDTAGNLYVADSGNQTIRRITPLFAVSKYAGQPGQAGARDGPADLAQFNSPTGLALDATGNLIVADANNHLLRLVRPGGTVATLAGASGQSGSQDGSGPEARLKSPAAVAVEPDGTLVIVDALNYILRTARFEAP